jgi:hypothetical protein
MSNASNTRAGKGDRAHGTSSFKGPGRVRSSFPVPGPTTRVAFAGIIRKVTTKIDGVGDKVGQIIIEFRPEGNVIADLDALHKPDAEIFVVIAEKAE